MLLNLRSRLPALALLALGLCWHTAQAQTPLQAVDATQVRLDATLQGAARQDRQFRPGAASLTVQIIRSSTATSKDKLFPDTPAPEGGWKGLARLLDALTPSVDTAIPLTPSQITDRITAMLDQGQNRQALEIIEKRMAQRQASGAIGTDVQLMFLHGRALAALGRIPEAIALYLDMTTLYPELPEPWNNLAALYARQNKIEMARDALQMALVANPDYPAAQANLGRVQLMLARQSFERAAQLGVPQAGHNAQQTQSILGQ